MIRNESLTLRELSYKNIARCEQGFRHPVLDWSISDWAVAVGGEIGETVEQFGKLLTFLDTVKKYKRLDDGDSYIDSLEKRSELLDKLAEEIADIVIYADLFCSRIGRDLPTAIIKKFNEVSDKRGSDIKL